MTHLDQEITLKNDTSKKTNDKCPDKIIGDIENNIKKSLIQSI